jgi:hypothetical protein
LLFGHLKIYIEVFGALFEATIEESSGRKQMD